MNKKYFLLIATLFLTLGLVLVFNFRYPFFRPKGGMWSVGYDSWTKLDPPPKISGENVLSYKFIDSVSNEKVGFIADPFFIRAKDSFYLFVEQAEPTNGNIALLTSADGNNYEYRGVVLDQEYHLSYPQVFFHENSYYMLPETKTTGNVILYKAMNFPYDWEVSDTLLKNKYLKDPSILLSDSLNLIVTVDDNLQQYFFTADSLHGEWKEAKNYRGRWGNESRPGGRFFELEGAWYLPLQNRRLGYGTGISLYKLGSKNGQLQLLKEKENFLGPQVGIKWFESGMHHIDIQRYDGKFYAVYDGRDKNGDKKEFQYIQTLKFNFTDFYKKIMDIYHGVLN